MFFFCIFIFCQPRKRAGLCQTHAYSLSASALGFTLRGSELSCEYFSCRAVLDFPNVSETKDVYLFLLFFMCVRASIESRLCLDVISSIVVRHDVLCLRRQPHAVHVLAAVLARSAFFCNIRELSVVCRLCSAISAAYYVRMFTHFPAPATRVRQVPEQIMSQ